MPGLPPEIEAAATELGVTLDLPPEEIRRAYLRKVKQHKPELDPAGFKRVREAFEQLIGWHAFVAQRVSMEPGPSPEPTADPPSPAPVEIVTSKWFLARQMMQNQQYDASRELLCR